MTSMYAVHMHENKKKENKLLRNLLCNLLRNLLRNPLNPTWLCTKASQTFNPSVWRKNSDGCFSAIVTSSNDLDHFLG